MRAGYFGWLQQKRCNELLHLWGMILPLCHRSFQFSPALAGVLLYKMNVATFQFSFLREERSPRKDMITQGNSYFNSRSLLEERCCIPKVVHGLLAISILAPPCEERANY